MAYQKLNVKTLLGAIQSVVENGTGLKCYDAVPLNATSPFYFMEFSGSLPANTKTMFRDNMTVYIHCIAEKSESTVQVADLIDQLREALTADISLPDPFELIMQTEEGIQTIKTDETGEKHGIVAYTFMVCYGFRCKI